MAGAPTNVPEFLDLVKKSGVVDDKRLDSHIGKLQNAGQLPTEPSKVAGVLIRDGFLTHFQADNILQGKWRRFTIGKYKVLEKIGSGGMGQVYLCEHKLMRRRVAVKVLPTAKAADDAARERFYREARAVAALDHPNIVHAYDIDQDENLHFLVMEYVDGASLQDIVKKTGPLELKRAYHYLRQAALGLQHAHEACLVHRDIKPGNIMLDRSGVVKILDMGLARFFNDEDDVLTKKYDDNNMGTLDYQAPEQAIDSHAVDIRADIYGLGATFFFMLTGNTPCGEGTIAQKALWHQTREPRPLSDFRSDVPPAIQDMLNTMMAKDPDQRYLVPAEVAEVLTPFTCEPIGPPPDNEMPRLSPAASGGPSSTTGPEPSVAHAVTQISGSSPSNKPMPAPVAGSKPAPNSPAPKNKPATPAPARPPAAPPAPARPPVAQPAPGRPPAAPPGRPPAPQPAPMARPTLPATRRQDGQPLPAAKPVVTLTAEDNEDTAPWAAFAADTDKPTARDDTPSRPVRNPGLNRGEQLAKRREKRRLAIVVGTLTVSLLAIVAILLARFVFMGGGGGAGHSTGRAPLTVSRDGTKGFKTIRQALQAAQAGDTIEIYDVVHEENLVVDQRGAHVTLQAAPGVSVRWVPASKDERTPLVHVAKAPGFHIKGKGIAFDGMIDETHRVQNLIFITLASPGLVIDGASFMNIGKNAVKVMNAQGAPNQFIRLVNLSAPEEAGKEVIGVALDANPDTTPSVNDYIEVKNFTDVATPFWVKDDSVVGANIIRP
jgi:serine/threonine protein kinase